MGVATIIENQITKTNNYWWSRVPELPSLNLDLQKYNQSFVNFVVLVGAVTFINGSIYLGKKALSYSPKSKIPPSQETLHQKYGYHSWALISDVRNNQDYCIFLAKNGFNLILVGEKDDISIVSSLIEKYEDIKVERIVWNWKSAQTDLKSYEKLVEQVSRFDISFLVLPKIEAVSAQNFPSHVQSLPPFQHIYLLVRYFGQILKWRSYRSAMIFPSYPQVDDITCTNGISKALISGADAFGRIIGYELRDTVHVVVARGSVENAFACLGKQRISF